MGGMCAWQSPTTRLSETPIESCAAFPLTAGSEHATRPERSSELHQVDLHASLTTPAQVPFSVHRTRVVGQRLLGVRRVPVRSPFINGRDRRRRRGNNRRPATEACPVRMQAKKQVLAGELPPKQTVR